jgi:hypothetical protein
MPIPAPTPKTVPQTEEKTFPDLWFHSWVFAKASPVDPGWLRIDRRYHNAETGEVLEGPEGDAGRIYSDDLTDVIENVPEAAAAYGALMAAVPVIEAYLEAKNAPPVEEEV